MNPNRKPIIAGNWKMYKTASEAVTLVQTLKAAAHTVSNVTIVICPPFTALSNCPENTCPRTTALQLIRALRCFAKWSMAWYPTGMRPDTPETTCFW